MGKTTVRPGNPYYNEGGRMPSTTGNPSGVNRGNNPPGAPNGRGSSAGNSSSRPAGNSSNSTRRK